MAKDKESITGITISKDAVCLAQYVPEEKVVANISIQPIDLPGDDFWESAEEALKELGRTMKLSGENVVASLPGEHAVIRTLCLDADEDNSDETLEWEFSQQIIGSRDEYVYDFEKQAASPKAGLDQFLVVGYRTEALNKLIRLLRANKLNPVIVDLDVFALINVHEANYDDNASAPSLLVLAEEKLTKCVLAKSGSFVDVEIIKHEADVQTVDAYAALLNNAIGKMLACNPGLAARESLSVYLSGSLLSDAQFAQELEKAVQNAEILYPFRKISCGTGMAEEDLRKYSPQLAVAIGLALRETE